MLKHDQKKQLRKHKKKVKQLGNQTARSRTKKLLRDDPTNDQLLEQPKHGKLTSEGLNGLDVDKTRNTTHHQQNAKKEEPEETIHPLEVAVVAAEATFTLLDIFCAIGEATA